jgi:predicted nucleotidyltransferase
MPLLSPEELQSTLDAVVERLRSALSPSAIYFFGSYVYGQPNRHSDIDLVVVIEESTESPYQRDAVAIRALRGIKAPIDVQVYTRAEFEGRASLPVSFERTVRNKARVVYAA